MSDKPSTQYCGICGGPLPPNLTIFETMAEVLSCLDWELHGDGRGLRIEAGMEPADA